MNKPLADKHRNAQMRLEMAEFAVKQKQAERRLKVLNEYDVLKSGSSRLRRVPSPEYDNEEGVLSGYKRGQAIAMGRDLQRNYAGVSAALNQFLLNVVGRGPKAQFHSKTAEKWAESAADWFNGDWSKACDFRDDLNFAEMIGLLEMAIKREGDALEVFDDFGLVPGEAASGKVLWYEADQFVEIDDLKTAAGGRWAGFEQCRGVIYDKWGRRVAYAVAAKNGAYSVKAADATIFPAALVRHIKRVWRFNQVRGVPALLAIAGDAEDLYELQSKEIQTAKTQSSFGGVVKKSESADENDTATTDSRTSTGARYRNLEVFTGGRMEYLEEGDEFTMLDWNRPALNFVESMDQLLRKSMSALGLSQTYSLLRVTSSYTAFRGEMLLAWAQFTADQKFLERHACDWTAEKALRWKYGGAVPADLSMSWDWPRMPAVDPLHEAQAVELLIKTLQSNYEQEFGPDWRKKMEQLAEEIKAAKKAGLPTVWEAEKQGLRFDGMPTRSANSEDGSQGGPGEDGNGKTGETQT